MKPSRTRDRLIQVLETYGATEAFLKNTKNYSRDMAEYLYRVEEAQLLFCFEWDNTPEGFDFWYFVDKEARGY